MVSKPLKVSLLIVKSFVRLQWAAPIQRVPSAGPLFALCIIIKFVFDSLASQCPRLSVPDYGVVLIYCCCLQSILHLFMLLLLLVSPVYCYLLLCCYHMCHCMLMINSIIHSCLLCKISSPCQPPLHFYDHRRSFMTCCCVLYYYSTLLIS